MGAEKKALRQQCSEFRVKSAKLEKEVSRKNEILEGVPLLFQNPNVSLELKNHAFELQALATHYATTRELKHEIAGIVQRMETANADTFELLIEALEKHVTHVTPVDDASTEPVKRHKRLSKKKIENEQKNSEEHVDLKYEQLLTSFKQSFSGMDVALDEAVLRKHFERLQPKPEDVDLHMELIQRWNEYAKSLQPQALQEGKGKIAAFLSSLFGTSENMAGFMKKCGNYLNTKDSSGTEASVINASTMLQSMCHRFAGDAAKPQPRVPTIDIPFKEDKIRGTDADPMALTHEILAWATPGMAHLGGSLGGTIQYKYG